MKLLFYKGIKDENPSSTLWDNIVCSVTRSRFSHVELSVLEVDKDHMCWSSSTRDGGVRYTRVNTSSNNWVEVPIFLYPSNVHEFFSKEEGKPYDYLGLIGTIIHLPIFSRRNKWFCSEIIAEFLKLKDPWKYTPEDLYRKYT